MDHDNDDRQTVSEATRCSPDDLESVRAWILVELVSDDVDPAPLLADLAICDARIDDHRIRSPRMRPVLHCVS
jgi:hypothetical protein